MFDVCLHFVNLRRLEVYRRAAKANPFWLQHVTITSGNVIHILTIKSLILSFTRHLIFVKIGNRVYNQYLDVDIVF